jgi:hypothetical protein
MTKKECQLVSEVRGTPHGEAPENPQESLLSPHRAFVVQFRMETGTASERFTGRVEHIVSGRAARFHSPQELLAFFTETLVNVHE